MIKKYVVKGSGMVPTEIVCDVCQVEFDDPSEIAEFLSIEFVTGKASLLGPGKKISIDICQDCFIDEFATYYAVDNVYDTSLVAEEQSVEQMIEDERKADDVIEESLINVD